jgi:hypothetical protein
VPAATIARLHKATIKAYRDSVYAANKEHVNYISFNSNTIKNGKYLVGVMEFKIPQQLEITWRQGVHSWKTCTVSKCLEPLKKEYDFTIYHLGNGNTREGLDEEAQKDLETSGTLNQKWIETRDWQDVPIVNHFINPDTAKIDVRRSQDQQMSLEIFKRAAILTDMTHHCEEVPKMNEKYITYNEKIESPPGLMTLSDAAAQWGFPSEYKTAVLSEQFKLYSVYEEGLKLSCEKGWMWIEGGIATLKAAKKFTITTPDDVELPEGKEVTIVKLKHDSTRGTPGTPVADVVEFECKTIFGQKSDFLYKNTLPRSDFEISEKHKKNMKTKEHMRQIVTVNSDTLYAKDQAIIRSQQLAIQSLS